MRRAVFGGEGVHDFSDECEIGVGGYFEVEAIALYGVDGFAESFDE